MAWPFNTRPAPAQRAEPIAPAAPDVVEVATRVPRVPRRRAGPVRLGRSYDAGETDRFTAGWTTTPLTADQVIDRNLRPLVARSRQQAASNDYMRNFLRLCRQNIVGSRGVALQAQARDENGTLDTVANQALETWWRKWSRAENCDVKGRRSFRQLLQSAVQTAAKDGEFMFRELRGEGPMGYMLQPIDPQRCPVDFNVERLPGGRFVRQGIEFSREGRALAYYFQTADAAGNSGYTSGGSALDRVPAGEIIHGFLDEIEGQRRGIPWAATALWRLNMLNGFEKSALTNARIGASKSGFFEWREGYGPDDDDDDEDEELVIEHAGGEFRELAEGLTFKEWNPQFPSGDFAPFKKAMLQGAGAGLGVAYVSFANDLEGVNFSSIRQGVLDEREHWQDLQEWLIETLVDRVYRGALEISLLLGLVTDGKVRLRPESRAKYESVIWQGRRWPWVDPTKDVAAEVEAKNNLLTAPSEIIRKQGRDPSAVWRTYASDIAEMRAAKIPDEIIAAAILGVAPAPPAPQNTPATEEGGDDETDA